MARKKDSEKRPPLAENQQPQPTTQPAPEVEPAAQSLMDVGEAQQDQPRATGPEVHEPVTPEENYRGAAKQDARDTMADQETRMEAIAESGTPYIGPPPVSTSPVSRPVDDNPTPSSPLTGGGTQASGEQTEPLFPKEPHTEVTPEGTRADETRSPGERIRRRAAH